jgi:uncharacterized protein
MEWSFEKFDNQCKVLASSIKDKSIQIEALCAIARGGIVPARILSNYLQVKRIYTIGLEYKNSQRHELLYYSYPEIKENTILLIEDFLETGRSLQKGKQDLQKQGKLVFTACLAYSHHTEIIPDFSFGVFEHLPRLPWDEKA